MQIIANAGGAFNDFKQAVASASKDNFSRAEELLRDGYQLLLEAHRLQTGLLTDEAKGQSIPFSLLLVHAEDHLMNALQYKQIASDLINLYKNMKGVKE